MKSGERILHVRRVQGAAGRPERKERIAGEFLEEKFVLEDLNLLEHKIPDAICVAVGVPCALFSKEQGGIQEGGGGRVPGREVNQNCGAEEEIPCRVKFKLAAAAKFRPVQWRNPAKFLKVRRNPIVPILKGIDCLLRILFKEEGVLIASRNRLLYATLDCEARTSRGHSEEGRETWLKRRR